MDNLIQLILQNFLISIFFVFLVLIYICFEVCQAKNLDRYLSVQDAIIISNREKGIFLDVRDDKSYSQKHIVGAIHVNTDDLKSSMKILKRYINTPAILYCRDNSNTKAVYNTLVKNGHRRLYILKGGFKQWCSDKMPVESLY